MDDRKWFQVTYRFRHNGSEHTETVEKFTNTFDSAQAGTWALLLLRYPGAIYLAHSYDGGITWLPET